MICWRIDVKTDEEEQGNLLLCSMSDSWDNLIMSFSHITKLDMDSVVASLLSKELRSVIGDNYFIFRIVGLGFRESQ